MQSIIIIILLLLSMCILIPLIAWSLLAPSSCGIRVRVGSSLSVQIRSLASLIVSPIAPCGHSSLASQENTGNYLFLVILFVLLHFYIQSLLKLVPSGNSRFFSQIRLFTDILFWGDWLVQLVIFAQCNMKVGWKPHFLSFWD